jgi:hypothetical protein
MKDKYVIHLSFRKTMTEEAIRMMMIIYIILSNHLLHLRAGK